MKPLGLIDRDVSRSRGLSGSCEKISWHHSEQARELGMSVSTFHHHFKAVTAMSPLQFQKQFRLQEARRIMLGEKLDAASAGYRVGYDDATQFSREYKRLFGQPPMRDMERLREAARR
jgi:AraC-like DNA-binding protein